MIRRPTRPLKIGSLPLGGGASGTDGGDPAAFAAGLPRAMVLSAGTVTDAPDSSFAVTTAVSL